MMGSPCSMCKWYDREVQDATVCAAFPDGIPNKILMAGTHNVPVAGDGGITFEPTPDVADLFAKPYPTPAP